MKDNERLMDAIGTIDADLVERAARRPALTLHPLLRFAAVAAALVITLAAGAGVWFGLDGRQNPPIDNPDTTNPTTTTTTQSTGDGTGGDWSCPEHSELFHWIPGELSRYVSNLVGEEKYNAYMQKKDADGKQTFFKDTTYPYECYSPGSEGLPGYLKEWGITREQFIEAMGWGDFLDHVYQEGYPYVEEGSYYHFTYRDVVDAIYGDDPHLTAWVFHNTANHADLHSYQDFYYDDWVYITRHGDPVWDYIYENYRGFTNTKDAIREFSTACKALEDEEPDNVFHLVQHFGIDRETFIGLYGWKNKLDEKATEHFPYAPYTYRQFVDAVYGDDAILRSWIFNPLVFHPDYPTLEEFATLSEGDRFYCAPFTVTPLEPIQREELCTEHNPMYHDLSNFKWSYVLDFKAAYAGRDKEELNIVNFAQYMENSTLTYSFDGAYDFSLERDRDKIAVDHGVGCPYTYGQFYYAIFGSDPELTAWVFAPTSTWPQAAEWPPTGEWPPAGYGYEKKITCMAHAAVYHDLSYFPAQMVEEYKASVSSGNEENYNLFDFINYHQLNKFTVASYLGFPNYLSKAMDEPATIFGKDYTYTYNQYLDAIYGEDSELTERVFGTVSNCVTTTTTRDPNWGKDEFGNTTTRTQP